MQKNNLAARAGRWSAQHRKRAILGWIAFVILATVIGGAVGQQLLADEDIGQRRVPAPPTRRSPPPASPNKTDEQVLVQGRGGVQDDDPRSRPPSATSSRG